MLIKMKRLVMIILAFSISACAEKEELHIPEGILDKEQMVRVMTDIYIIDAATNLQNFQGITMPADPRVSYEKFLKKDNATYGDFNRSYEFYLKHPKELSEIYNEVLNELSRQQAEHSKK
jgi:hypothetical protein